MEDKVQQTILDKAADAAGINQKMRMVGMQSTKAATDYEQEELQNEADIIHQAMTGEKRERQEQTGEEDMRDIFNTGTIHLGKESETDRQRTDTNGQPGRRPSGISPLSIGLGTAAAVGALSLPILAWNMTKQEPPPAQENQFSARFVPVQKDAAN